MAGSSDWIMPKTDWREAVDVAATVVEVVVAKVGGGISHFSQGDLYSFCKVGHFVV